MRMIRRHFGRKGRYAQTAYLRLRKDGQRGRPIQFFGMDPPRWRIFLSVGKRLKKQSGSVIVWTNVNKKGRYAQTAYLRLRKDGQQDRPMQFFGIDPPRWRIFLSVGKRLKKNSPVRLLYGPM